MQLVFLGTGGCWPSKARNVPSTALRIGREILLLDCGEGTQRQLLYTDLSFMKVTNILITHFHGDHFLGLPGLIQSMYLNDRKKPLDIYGPPGACKIIRTFLELGYFSVTFKVNVYDLTDGTIINRDGYDIKVREVEHGVPALCYCIEEHQRPGKFNRAKALELGIPEGPLFSKLQHGNAIEVDGKKISPDMVMGLPRKGRKVVYSGDTKPTDAVVELARDCDVLIHEATLDSSLEGKAEAYGHTSARQAAEIAKKAHAKMLFLVHISPRYDEEAKILEDDAKAVFENTTVAKDLLVYDVRYSE